MNEFLLRQAVDSFWCNPSQDRQHVFEPKRLTPVFGVRDAYTIAEKRYALPIANTYFHVYQVGKVLPRALGLPRLYETWYTLEDLGNKADVLAEAYNDAGIQYPRSNAYWLLTNKSALILAIPFNSRVSDLNVDTVYLRFYKNAYYQSKRSDVPGNFGIVMLSAKPRTLNELAAFQFQVDNRTAELGQTPIVTVNGRFASGVNLNTCTIDDTIEVMYDASIIGHIDFDLKDLKFFTSTMDSEDKYLLHNPDRTIKTIEYHDDLECYLYKRDPVIPTRFQGINYHRNRENWLRQLTQQDYSAPVPLMTALLNEHPDDPRHALNNAMPADQWGSLNELTLRVYRRLSGYDRPLIADVNRIQELYRLNDEQIQSFMVGTLSTNPLWRAANLEASPYIEFMTAVSDVVMPIGWNDPDVDTQEKRDAQELAGAAYGYLSAGKVLGNTPSTVYVSNGTKMADLGYLYWTNATVFEYDANGVLLDHHFHAGGNRYLVRNPNTVRVEAIVGKGGESVNTQYGADPVTLVPGHNFRVYICPLVNGVPSEQWSDITDDPNRGDMGQVVDYPDGTRKWVWRSIDSFYGAVRQDDEFVLYNFQLNKSTEGILKFGLVVKETREGVPVFNALKIPLAQYDLFLNGRSLVEGIDYWVDGAAFYISNLEYQVAGDVQDLTIRAFGFCNSDLTRNPLAEVGFVSYGVLSRNGVYNVHNNKVQRVVVDGHYRDSADVVYSEDLSQNTITNERNGAPYAIQDVPLIFRDVYVSDYDSREADLERDVLVSNALTPLIGDPVKTNVDVIIEPYHVVSVFTNKLIFDMLNNLLDPVPANGSSFTSVEIREIVTPYRYLVDVDIANHLLDAVRMRVYPHWYSAPVTLSVFKRAFLQKAIDMYLDVKPQLSPFVTVNG